MNPPRAMTGSAGDAGDSATRWSGWSSRVSTHMRRQPGRAARALLVTGLLLVAVPIAVVLVAGMIAVALLAAGMVVARRAVDFLRMRGWLPRGDGRKNVRIIVRQGS